MKGFIVKKRVSVTAASIGAAALLSIATALPASAHTVYIEAPGGLGWVSGKNHNTVNVNDVKKDGLGVAIEWIGVNGAKGHLGDGNGSKDPFYSLTLSYKVSKVRLVVGTKATGWKNVT